jgi:hypothetical protein
MRQSNFSTARISPRLPSWIRVQERHPRLGVVPRDRHHETEVRLDEALLGLLIASVLELGERALLRRRQQAAVADLADVELQRILRPGPQRRTRPSRSVDLRVVECRNELELGAPRRQGRRRTLFRHP